MCCRMRAAGYRTSRRASMTSVSDDACSECGGHWADESRGMETAMRAIGRAMWAFGWVGLGWVSECPVFLSSLTLVPIICNCALQTTVSRTLGPGCHMSHVNAQFNYGQRRIRRLGQCRFDMT